LLVVCLGDTPDFMVGPDTEATAQVRHVSRLFVVSVKLRLPVFSVVLRKGYGLGAMGLEGAVRLGDRKALVAVPVGEQRDALFQLLLERQHENG
jgi:acetyl-CoA carboxylase carboxyltransferase component